MTREPKTNDAVSLGLWRGVSANGRPRLLDSLVVDRLQPERRFDISTVVAVRPVVAKKWR